MVNLDWSLPIYMEGIDSVCTWCGSCTIPSTVCRWISSHSNAHAYLSWEWNLTHSCTLEPENPSSSWIGLASYLAAGTAMMASVTLQRLVARRISTVGSYLRTWVPFLPTAITVGNGRYACIPTSVKKLIPPTHSACIWCFGEYISKYHSSSSKEIVDMTKLLQEFPKANLQVGIRLVVR